MVEGVISDADEFMMKSIMKLAIGSIRDCTSSCNAALSTLEYTPFSIDLSVSFVDIFAMISCKM